MVSENVRGVWPVMLTPFCNDGAIDWDGLDALIEWYLAAGVAGLFAACLSSEMYELTPEERVRLAAHVVDRAAGRVPVVAGGAFGDSITAQAETARMIPYECYHPARPIQYPKPRSICAAQRSPRRTAPRGIAVL
jgi:dihydrodipicolinate synthase/N-acetylneuraminate lyase